MTTNADQNRGIMYSAADEAVEQMRSLCTNSGMHAMGDMLEGAIYDMAEEMAQEEIGPDYDRLMGGIVSNVSGGRPDQSASVMAEPVAYAFESLMNGWDQVQAAKKNQIDV